MAPPPRISVLLPVYNAEAFLQEALDSLFAQTMKHFEIIAIDDGSSDKSAEILDAAAAKDSRLKVISRPNKGLTLTLNEALEHVQAPFVARADADDICLPDRFALQLARFDAEPDLVAISGGTIVMDAEGRDLRVSELPLEHEEIERWHLVIPNRAGMSHSAVTIRRMALDQIGGYSHDYPSAEDVDLYLRLGEVGRLANLSEPVLRYRVHMESIGHQRRNEQLDSAWRAARDAARRRGLPEREPLPDSHKTGRGAHDLTSRMVMWGWWALSSGNLSTARHYAVQALSTSPTSPKSWKLFVCTLRDTVKAWFRRAPAA